MGKSVPEGVRESVREKAREKWVRRCELGSYRGASGLVCF